MAISNGFIKRMFNRVFLCFCVCVIFLCFLSHHYSLADNFYQNDSNYNQEITDLLVLRQKNLLYSTMSIINDLKSSSPQKISQFVSDINNKFVCCVYSNTEGTSRSNIFIYVYNREQFYAGTDINTHENLNNDFVNVPLAEKKISCSRWQINTETRTLSSADNQTVYVPFQISFYKDYEFINFVNSLNSKNTNDVIVAINQCNQSINNVKSSVDETNKFLKDTNTTDSDYDFDSDNQTNDVSSNALNAIFTQIYNAFTKTEVSDIEFPLPFVNKSIVLEANFFRKLLNKYGLESIVYLTQTVWLFAISTYIIKDISKYVDRLKTGEILTKSDTNIKSDML